MLRAARCGKHRREIHQVDVFEADIAPMRLDAIIYHRHIMARIYERIHYVRPDEAAAASHNDLGHTVYPSSVEYRAKFQLPKLSQTDCRKDLALFATETTEIDRANLLSSSFSVISFLSGEIRVIPLLEAD